MPMIRVAMPLVGLLAVGVVSPPSAVAATPRCHGVVATIVGTDNRDELVGTSGRDVIVAGAGWDRIEGGGGSDLICGGRGSDHLWGGAGDDRLFGGADGALADDGTLDYYGDTLRGGVGDDRIVGGDAPGSDSVGFETARHGLSGDLATGVVTGQGRDTLVGLELLTGSRYADHLTVARPTRLVDGAGGDDVLRCRARTPCFVAGGDGDDRLLDVRGGHGGAGDDRITARAGGGQSKGSSLEGAQGDDILIGTDESDRLSGGYGRDILRAAGGDDTIENDRGDGIVYAGAGDDWIFDGPAVDKISAGPGDDTVQPESGHAETFDLGPGNDTIDFAQTPVAVPTSSWTVSATTS